VATIRQNQIARLIQRELGFYFQKEVNKYNEGGLITVTIVRVSPDFSIAKVYLSIFPKDKEKILENINSETKVIRHYLSQRIKNKMRFMPELEFFIDDSLDYIEKIENLLK
jgi:ribosome-binding factor A